jgi:tRNA(fMet)-specific endonuclease VapC
MIVLDTDHFSVLLQGKAAAQRLQSRLDSATEPLALTIVSVEELLRGWLAFIHGKRDPHAQIIGYQRLQEFISTLANWHILPWDTAAADQLAQLRLGKLRVATMDLKIASLALVHDATVLTRNQADFQKVPNLRLDDWLS